MSRKTLFYAVFIVALIGVGIWFNAIIACTFIVLLTLNSVLKNYWLNKNRNALFCWNRTKIEAYILSFDGVIFSIWALVWMLENRQVNSLFFALCLASLVNFIFALLSYRKYKILRRAAGNY